MARPRIFVSHSSCADTECECVRYRDAVVKVVDESGCDPVLDEQVLRVGDDWHRSLMRSLFSCQGTVLLLSCHALGSHYVLEEALISVALWEVTDRRFLVIPVCLPGTGRSEIAGSSLGRLDLGRFGMADWPRESGPDAAELRLHQRLEPLARWYGALPYPRVTELVAHRIRGLETPVLAEIAEGLEISTPAHVVEYLHYVVSAGLLRERPVAGLGAACALRAALGRFLHLLDDKEHRQEVVDLAVPFARVPGEAAGQLHAVRDSGETRVALLRAQWRDTEDMYVRRASEEPKPWLLYKPVPRSGTRFTDELIQDIGSFLVEQLTYGMSCNAEYLPQLLDRHERESGPITVVLRMQPDPELLRRLTGAFPRLLFLFSHSHMAPQADGEHTNLRALTGEQEQDMLLTYQKFSDPGR